ncbi:MAG: methyltransferase domain-containing protein [PS1 clade bacterium]|uniref:Methyltransferase domain-containing protein n=1 Tax=PS1 clade bacterium TaxID=2175152 RepID=A0A937HIE3_9PROT|nr:methyltransferase domain-containing protein [PS1 clade bacterium]
MDTKVSRNKVPRIFDRARLRRNRARRAAALAQYDFLLRRAADDLAGRIAVQNRHFETALCLGASGGVLREALNAQGGGRIATLIEADISANLVPSGGLVLDEEALPIKPQSLDLVVAAWGLHHVNDLPGALVQIRRALKPDGLFLAALPGGATLAPLRAAFLDAEAALMGGAQPHIHPFADLQDLAALMQRAGFALPVADSDMVAVRYQNPYRLLDDLRGMGEANILTTRPRRALRRDVLTRALAQFAATTQQAGKAVAEFELCYLAGWAPHDSHNKPHQEGQPITRFDESALPEADT